MMSDMSNPTPPFKAPPFKAPPFKAITLTDEAAKHAKRLIAEAPDQRRALRLGVKNAGCVGMAYTLDYVAQPEPLDEVVEDQGITIAIEPKALMFLLGTVMDYRADIFSAGFVFDNPNQIDQCGCGESVQLKPAELFAREHK